MSESSDLAAFLEEDPTVKVEILEVSKIREPKLGELRPFIPKSWLCPEGIRKVLKDLEPKLPNVSGSLFLTFTVDPSLFEGPEAAFDRARDRLRRLFHKLRKGVRWKGKLYKVDSPYCVKVEFHENGWPHFHSVFLTKRFLPGELLNFVWKLGRTNVERISNETFRYLLKYVTKSGEIPEWVKKRTRIRIFQSSRGFYQKRAPPTQPKKKQEGGAKVKVEITIGERLENWKKIAVLKRHQKSYTQIKLNQDYAEMAGKEALKAAKEGRYLGNGCFCINHPIQIKDYIK